MASLQKPHFHVFITEFITKKKCAKNIVYFGLKVSLSCSLQLDPKRKKYSATVLSHDFFI